MDTRERTHRREFGEVELEERRSAEPRDEGRRVEPPRPPPARPASSPENPLVPEDAFREGRASDPALGATDRIRVLVEALRQSEDRYRTLVDQSLQGVMILQGDSPRIVFANRAQARLMGRPLGEVLRMAPEELLGLLHPDDFEVTMARYQALSRSAWETERVEYRFQHASGEWRWVEASACAVVFGGAPAVQAVCFDITEQRETMERLRQSEEQYRLLAENVDDIIWTADLELNPVYVSPSEARMRGFPLSEIQGQKLDRRMTAGSTHRLRIELARALALEMTGTPSFPLTLEMALVRADGSPVPTETTVSLLRDDRGEPGGFLGVTRDISRRRAAEEERRALETQMQRAAQLESLGLLAGGVAHDFNNLLSSLRSNMTLVRCELPETSPAQARLRDMELASQRAADLCRQLLAYAGKGRFATTPVDLNDVVTEMAKLLEVSLSKKATFIRHLAPRLPAILADITQLRQVVLNLVTNASEALEGAPGTIRLKTGLTHCEPETLAASILGEDRRPGPYVYLEVEDTGMGMGEETRERIFEPFFSTKFAGRGLGLAAVAGILRAHRGAVLVESAPGQGTAFRVLFPATRRKACPTPMPEPEPGDWRGNGQLLLVVDDDRLGREGLELVLEHHGFQVASAAGGRQALELLRQHGEDVALVLLDLTMPDLDGVETYREIRRLRLDVPVVLCSGYGPDEVASRFAEDGAGLSGYLAKPFDVTTLLGKLRAVLG